MLTRIYKERLPSFGGYLCEGGRVNMTLVVRRVRGSADGGDRVSRP
jgi:hypothetical protein